MLHESDIQRWRKESVCLSRLGHTKDLLLASRMSSTTPYEFALPLTTVFVLCWACPRRVNCAFIEQEVSLPRSDVKAISEADYNVLGSKRLEDIGVPKMIDLIHGSETSSL